MTMVMVQSGILFITKTTKQLNVILLNCVRVFPGSLCRDLVVFCHRTIVGRSSQRGIFNIGATINSTYFAII